jgi:hypothetical protein
MLGFLPVGRWGDCLEDEGILDRYMGAGKDRSAGRKMRALVAARAIRKISRMKAGRMFWRKNCIESGEESLH